MLSLETENSLYALPIFSKIKSKDLLYVLIKINNFDLRRIVLILEERYKYSPQNLIKELTFWKKFKKNLKAEIKIRKGTVKGFLLGKFKTPYLEEKIINKLEQAKKDMVKK